MRLNNVENALILCNMFENCESLIELDLSNFKTKIALNMTEMFKNCKNLKKLDISNFIGEKLLCLLMYSKVWIIYRKLKLL